MINNSPHTKTPSKTPSTYGAFLGSPVSGLVAPPLFTPEATPNKNDSNADSSVPNLISPPPAKPEGARSSDNYNFGLLLAASPSPVKEEETKPLLPDRRADANASIKKEKEEENNSGCLSCFCCC